MNEVNSMLFWVSNGLMVPVIVLLFVSIVKAFLLLGAFANIALRRRQFNTEMVDALVQFKRHGKLPAGKSELNPDFYRILQGLIDDDFNMVHGEKLLSDFEYQIEKSLTYPRLLTKTGPMLGLMGTLIPMGPALVGLGAGDIASMAQNMQVAFATTVAGILVAGIGLLVVQFQQRWLYSDLANLDYILKVKSEQRLPTSPIPQNLNGQYHAEKSAEVQK